jgi:hypothetical protein
MEYVPDYESDSDEEIQSITSQEHQKKRKTKRNRNWIRDRTFSSKAEALSAIEKDGQWSFHYTNKTSEGKKDYYRCNQVKLRGDQCDAALHLLYDATSEDVIMFKTDNDHTHNLNNLRKEQFSDATKLEINKLIELKLKPKAILQALLEKGVQAKMSQLRNYLASYKRKKYGSSTISLGELEQWCQQTNNIPDDEDEPFVVSYNIIYDEEFDDDEEADDEGGSKFRIFISTKRLLKHAFDAKKLHVDATYKLIWQGFPVLIIGTSDMDRHFHIFGMAICSNEKTDDFKFIFRSVCDGLNRLEMETIQPEVLISDASDAICNAFQDVFGNKVMVMCWAHMRRNIVKKVESLVDKERRLDIIEDIETLQISANEHVFKKASECFIKKWKSKEAEFIKYFQEQWLKSHENWYEGVKHYTPSTNNCLESFNKVIKDEQTLRERLPLSRFKELAFEAVRKWSKEYATNQKQVINETTITLSTWTKAYQWAKSNKEVIINEEEESLEYYLPTSCSTKVAQTDVDIVKNLRWNTFDQFKKRAFQVWILSFPKNKSNWKNAKCNCPTFFKEFICKHVVGMALRLKLCKPPPAAKDVPIGEKRKRGRPKLASKALLKD